MQERTNTMECEAELLLIENKVKSLLSMHYEPVLSLSEAKILLTTKEVYEHLQEVFPSDDYSGINVEQWLNEAGFKLINTGVFKFEWMMKKRGNVNTEILIQ